MNTTGFGDDFFFYFPLTANTRRVRFKTGTKAAETNL